MNLAVAVGYLDWGEGFLPNERLVELRKLGYKVEDVDIGTTCEEKRYAVNHIYWDSTEGLVLMKHDSLHSGHKLLANGYAFVFLDRVNMTNFLARVNDPDAENPETFFYDKLIGLRVLRKP